MKKTYLILLIHLLLIGLPSLTFCSEDASAQYSNLWAVRLSPSVSPEWLASQHGLTFLGPANLSHAPDVLVFEFSDPADRQRLLPADDPRYLRFPSLRDAPSVLWAQRQRFLKRDKRAALPWPLSDPAFPNQWHLSGPLSVQAVGAWRPSPPLRPCTGQGVTIAVVDDGLQTAHPDFRDKWVPQGSRDFNGDDADPNPSPTQSHGTSAAGVAAAAANNGVCGCGVAPDAGVSGIRLLGGDTTDLMEAQALGYRRDLNAVFSNSWGPVDDGQRYEGPGPLTLGELTSHAGRGGLGSVYVWAGGNGRERGDGCNYDGYANLPETIAVAAYGQDGQQAYYSEACSALVVAAPSSDAARHGITTTTLQSLAGGCTSGFGGTSAAAPMVAGVVALMLEANAGLGWRDVQGVLIASADAVSGTDGGQQGYARNGAGLLYSHALGFGRVNAAAAVELAAGWKKYGRQQRYQTESWGAGRRTLPTVGLAAGFRVPAQREMTVEHVQVWVDVSVARRGAMEVSLVSPLGFVSVLQTAHSDNLPDLQWMFMSVAHWNEVCADQWTVRFNNKDLDYQVNEVYLVFYGRARTPSGFYNIF